MSATLRFRRVLKKLRQHLAAADRAPLADRDLLTRYVASRDEAAFAVLVKRHGPMVLRICRRLLRHVQDAEDAFQATFLILARKAAAIRKQESVSSWLHSVAFRVAYRLRGKSARQTARQRPLPELSQADGPTDLSWRDAQLVLGEELNRLDDKHRAPLVLCYVQGKTRDEAARQLGWTLTVFRGRLERGRERLRARLVRRGLSFAAVLLAAGVAEAIPAALPAALPAPLVCSTVQAASGAAGALATAGMVSARVATLAQGVIHTMFLSKLKIVAVGLFTALLLTAGTGLVAYRAFAGEPAGQEAASPEDQAAAQPAGDDLDPAKLKKEIERLRLDLQRTRTELKQARDELQNLRGQGKSAAKLPEDDATKRAVESLLEAYRERLRIEKHQQDEQERQRRQSKQLYDEAVRAILEYQREKKTQKEKDEVVRQVIRWLQESAEKEQPDKKAAPPKAEPPAPTAVSPDGRIIATAKDGMFALLEAASGKVLAQCQGHKELVSALAFSPDGKLIASGGKDKALILWDLPTGRQVRHLVVPAPVAAIVFDPNGRTIFLVEPDGARRQFDLATGKELRALRN